MWCFLDGIIEYHIEGLEKRNGKLNAKLFASQIWLGVSTLSKRLFTTNQRRFLLILICEGSQIFVWRNKAFIFFQKSDIVHCRLLQTQLRQKNHEYYSQSNQTYMHYYYQHLDTNEPKDNWQNKQRQDNAFQALRETNQNLLDLV